ncbi:MAG: hypothetical protein PF517_13700 [Salinivirgaceae bacterium]|jgi:hypothetical protein|nr:hypothetical protein [Salinivirgaceae bacterium]
MAYKYFIAYVFAFLLLDCYAYSQNKSTQSSHKSLINETMLHPADAFTGYTLNKGAWIYNQALTPYPSWAWWGITDRITAELDFECWLGGVPSFNFRFALANQNNARPAIAFETMYQFLDNELDQFHNLDYLKILREGNNWYNRINMSWQLNNNIHLHLSGGASYTDFISISNGDSINIIGKTFQNYISPDFSIGLDYFLKKWITLHTTASYGSTFLYADNIIRKQQILIASRIAPFINSTKGFLNSFRVELAFLHANFADANESITGPIGYLYWQWQWKKL